MVLAYTLLNCHFFLVHCTYLRFLLRCNSQAIRHTLLGCRLPWLLWFEHDLTPEPRVKIHLLSNLPQVFSCSRKVLASAVVYSIFTGLCNSNSRACSHPKKKPPTYPRPVPIAVSSQTLAATDPLSVSLDFPILDISCK